MDVKDVTRPAPAKERPVKLDPNTKQREVSTLVTTRVPQVQAESVKVEVKDSSKEKAGRSALNDVISFINLASDAVSNVDELARSIDGIVQLAQKSDLPDRRVAALEREANELVSKIREIGENAPTPRTIPEDEVRSQIEQKLGRSLDAILPEETRAGFGFEQIQLSPKDRIINTLATVKEARDRIDNLRKEIHSTQQAVESVVAAAEVAAQNSEAADVSIRDVDRAAAIATEARISIFDNPERALKSVGQIDTNMLELLK